MSLKINAYLRKSMDDDSSSANPGGEEEPGFISSRPGSWRTRWAGDENQPSTSRAGNDGSNSEGYRADNHQSPEVSALQSLPMNQPVDLRSVSPVTAESNPEPSTSPSPPSDSHSSRSSGKSRNREKPAGICKVCGDVATGKYFGALVCVPCKTFFLRYNGEGFSFVCKNKQACDISVSTRIQCKYCRFQKCLAAGMTRKVRPPQVEPKEGKQLCVVCNDFGNGVHFGVVTCEGCKKFFRRGLVEHKSYVCKFNRCCPINPQTRNTCRYCRYNKCKSLGMSREAIQMGRPSKASQKQGALRTAERQLDEEVMDVDEEPSSTQALDLSITPSNSASQLHSASSSHQPSTSFGSPQATSSNGSSQPSSSSSSYNGSSQPSSSSSSSYNGSSQPSSSSSYNGSSQPSSSSYSGSSQPSSSSSSSSSGSSQPSSSSNGSSQPQLSSYNGSSQPSSSYSGSLQPSSCNGSFQPSSCNGSFQPSSCNGSLQPSSYNRSLQPSSSSSSSYNGSSQPLSVASNGMSQLSSSAISSLPHVGSSRPSSKSSSLVGSPLSSALPLNSPLPASLVPYALPEPMSFPPPASSFVPTPCIPQPLASFTASSPSASTSAISLGFRRGGMDSSETLLFASLPPSFQHNTCLAFNEVSDQIVPSFQLLNETQQALFQNLKLQAEGNLIENPLKRVTMVDVVDIFRGNKINVSNDKPNPWGSLRRPKDYSFYEGGRLRKHEGLYGHSDRWRNEMDDFVIEHKMRFRLNITKNYWLASLYPDENLHATDDKHLEIINMVVPNYGEFVSSSETINHNLTNNYGEWVMQNGQNMTAAVISEWIKTSVIPSFTIVSVKYFKQIPGFKSFDTNDQMNIARLGQSPSRILAAVLHWFDPELNNFKDFLSWRDRIPGNSDRFKKYLIRFANNVQLLNMDAVEAALLNALIIAASDYPNLVDPKVIESARTRLICTFRAYISTKYGASSDRMDKLFGIIPEIRKIGFFHHEMTNKKTMMAEEFGERLLKSFNF